MKRLITSLVLGGLISVGYAGQGLNEQEVKTTLMLVAHTKYMYKYNISPKTEPSNFLKAVRVCIITQMKEPGCDELLDNKLVKILIDS